MSARWYIIGLIAVLGACSLAPDYEQPKTPVPEAYKEAGDWIIATPAAAEKERGPWWTLYHDEDLNALEDRLTNANQDLKAALARYEEAHAAAAVARADYFPTVNANLGAARDRPSKTVGEVRSLKAFNDYRVGADLSYEIDVWGRVRNAVKAGASRADASAADLATMEVSLRTELAMDYFALRGHDAAQAILDQTVKIYARALKLTEARHEGGAASEADVDQATAQLETAKTLAADRKLQRAQLEHAIAVLVGELPSSFTIPVRTVELTMPPTIPGLPSTLLEQRPDVAAAAARMEAANADIGVARAAYFPALTLGGNAGWESGWLSKLFQTPSAFSALGVSGVGPIFDGGRVNAQTDQARAAYDEAVANYRATTLAAFQDVEDQLAALHRLGEETTTQKAAATAANRALAQANNRYEGGISTFLDVVVAQNTALQAQLSDVEIRTRHYTASVMLIKALGGGWQPPAPAH